MDNLSSISVESLTNPDGLFIVVSVLVFIIMYVVNNNNAISNQKLNIIKFGLAILLSFFSFWVCGLITDWASIWKPFWNSIIAFIASTGLWQTIKDYLPSNSK
jgi:hypothetical protein